MPSDSRAARAREENTLLEEARRQADQHRDQRNRLIRLLRAEDPQRWTYPALAAAVGIDMELVRAICKGRT